MSDGNQLSIYLSEEGNNKQTLTTDGRPASNRLLAFWLFLALNLALALAFPPPSPKTKTIT